MQERIHVEPFKIIGISVRTTNKNGQSSSDIGQLWSRFFSENLISQIPNKASDEIYSVYTDYESDYTGKYTSIIGCKVNSLDQIPSGFTGKEITGGKYLKYTIKGKIPDVIANKWQEIWKNDKELNRRYSADFEVYGEKSQNPKNAETDLYLSVK